MNKKFQRQLNIITTPRIISNRIKKIQKIKENITILKNKKVVFTSKSKYKKTQEKIKNTEKIFNKINYRAKILNNLFNNATNIIERKMGKKFNTLTIKEKNIAEKEFLKTVDLDKINKYISEINEYSKTINQIYKDITGDKKPINILDKTIIKQTHDWIVDFYHKEYIEKRISEETHNGNYGYTDGSIDAIIYNMNFKEYYWNQNKNITYIAAILLRGLINNHCFVDGNKRTAFICTKMFLEENNFKFHTNVEMTDIFLKKIAEKNYTLRTIWIWIRKNTKLLSQ